MVNCCGVTEMGSHVGGIEPQEAIDTFLTPGPVDANGDESIASLSEIHRRILHLCYRTNYDGRFDIWRHVKLVYHTSSIPSPKGCTVKVAIPSLNQTGIWIGADGRAE